MHWEGNRQRRDINLRQENEEECKMRWTQCRFDSQPVFPVSSRRRKTGGKKIGKDSKHRRRPGIHLIPCMRFDSQFLRSLFVFSFLVTFLTLLSFVFFSSRVLTEKKMSCQTVQCQMWETPATDVGVRTRVETIISFRLKAFSCKKKRDRKEGQNWKVTIFLFFFCLSFQAAGCQVISDTVSCHILYVSFSRVSAKMKLEGDVLLQDKHISKVTIARISLKNSGDDGRRRG